MEKPSPFTRRSLAERTIRAYVAPQKNAVRVYIEISSADDV